MLEINKMYFFKKLFFIRVFINYVYVLKNENSNCLSVLNDSLYEIIDSVI